MPPYERGIGMVVQIYALFPPMRVEDNVAFGCARGALHEDGSSCALPSACGWSA
jgi:ABC-type Fe3+/spermidine/putrescine transport system ATPase subunit